MNCFEFWNFALEVMIEQEKRGIPSNEGIVWEKIQNGGDEDA